MSDVLRNGEPLRFTLEPGGSVMAGGIRVRNTGQASASITLELVKELHATQPRGNERLLRRMRRSEGQG